MADIRQEIVDFLKSFPAVAARFGNRIWPGANLPHGFNPTAAADLDAILFTTPAGNMSYVPVYNPQVRIECYGIDDVATGDSADMLMTTLHNKQTARVSFHLAVGRQDTADPATGWPIGLTIWTARIRLKNEELTWQQ